MPTTSNNINSEPNNTGNPLIIPETATKTSDNQKIDIILWNIRGIHDKVFECSIQNFLFQNDIIILTETHTNYPDEKVYNKIPGFIYKDFPRKFIHPRAPGPSGGIGIFINVNIYEGVKFKCTTECIVWVILKSAFFGWETDKHIACIYFSPEDSSYIHSTNVRTDYFNILTEQTANLQQQDIFLCGDLNARTAKLIDYPQIYPGTDGGLEELTGPYIQNMFVENLESRKSRDQVVNEYGRNLLQFCKTSGFRIMNGRLGNTSNTSEFTCFKHNGASIVDYLICKPSSITHVADLKIHPKRVESDHAPIQFSLKVTKALELQESDSNCKIINDFKWDHRKIQEYKDNFKNKHCQGKADQLMINIVNADFNSDKLCTIYNAYLKDAIGNIFKTKKTKKGTVFPQNKWFNDECKNMKKLVNEFPKKYDITIAPLSGQYQKLEAEYTRIKQLHKRNYQKDTRLKLENMHSNQPSAYWKFWKSLDYNSTNNSKLSLNDHNLYFKTQIRPPSVNYFDQSHMDEIHSFIENYWNQPQEPEDYPNLSDEICNGVISLNNIKYHLGKLKNNKASGADGICGEFLKYAPDELSNILFSIFNYILDKGDWPSSWAEGIIHPVHKKASINVADNYRKITVMPAAGKVLESILNSRLIYRNIVLDLDDPYQFGFKKDARTTDNLFILNSLIERQKFKNKPLYICFVDFTKAFDYVDRGALYYKLIKRGVRGKMLKLICDMYAKSKCRVKWKNKMGKSFDSLYGVLQGGMLSPKLFTEFLTDLKNYLNKECGILLDDEVLMYILYADDLVLCSETAIGLQKLLDGLFKFCSKWHLIVSLLKTNVVIFSRKKQTQIFKFNDQIIEIVNEYKYVGTIFSSKTTDVFKKNYGHLAEKTENAIFALRSFVKNSVGQLQPNLSFKTFDSQISPIMEYASEIWYSNKRVDDLEKIHLKFLKNSLHVKNTSVTNAIYAECGRFPLILKQKCQVIKYWLRILKLDNKYIIKKAYNSLLELHELGQENWCTHVKHILMETELSQAWDDQNIDIATYKVLKEKLYKTFMENCINSIQNSDQYPKLRTYKLFKDEFKLENYLITIQNINHALALTRFRISSHNLRIETGRYTRPNKTPPDQRTCLYCPSQAVEDEMHFLLKCSFYDTERLILITKVKMIISNIPSLTMEEKFKIIMSTHDQTILDALGKYIYTCLKKRSNTNIVTTQLN